jgi:hypothetical protein
MNRPDLALLFFQTGGLNIHVLPYNSQKGLDHINIISPPRARNSNIKKKEKQLWLSCPMVVEPNILKCRPTFHGNPTPTKISATTIA